MPERTTADLPALLDALGQAHAAGTADGSWGLVDNGPRDPLTRYEVRDDEGTVAVCTDDNNETATAGSQRADLIVAAVNHLPALTATVRAVLALADELDTEARRHDDAEPVSSDGLSRMILAARHCRENADRIRATVTAGIGGRR